MKGLWRLHLHYIHSRCWLDLVEPGPVVLGAGFSCLFLQVWCLMLIPPHVPWVLSKHAEAGDSAGRPTLSPACLLLSFCLPWWPTHPHCGSSSSSRQAVLSSLPVIRVSALTGWTWYASVLYFFYFTLSPDLCFCLGSILFWCAVRFTQALLQASRQAKVTQSGSTGM